MADNTQPQPIESGLVPPAIVTFPTEVDITTTKAVAAELRAAFRPGVTVIIADLRETVFCDSAGIGHLWMAGNHAVCIGCQVRVVVGEGEVRAALDVLGNGQTLALYSDMEAAMTDALDTGPDANLLGDVG